MTEYCCEDFKLMLEEYVIDEWKDEEYRWMKSRFPRERYSIREQIEYDEFGAVHIKYCPRCGAKI
jgi:hypothetical protein